MKKRYAIVIVLFNLQQAARVSDFAAFFFTRKIVEVDSTEILLTRPQIQQTEDYIAGRFA